MISKILLAICLVPLLLVSENLLSQNLNGYKIYVSKRRLTTLYFHDKVTNNHFGEKNYPYAIDGTMRNEKTVPLSVSKDVKEPYTLYVTEGPREHKFIIIYKDVIDIDQQDIFFTDLKNLATIAKQEETQAVPNTQVNNAPVKQENVTIAPQQSTDNKTGYALIDEADKAKKSEQLEVARDKYQQALQILPESQYAQTKLTEVKGQIAARDSIKYNQAIKNANNAFAVNNLDDALKYYTEALSMKPNNAYLNNQIKTVQQKITDAKAKEEQHKQDSLFQSYVYAGDKSLLDKSYETAKAAYRKALEIRPNDAIATSKLNMVDQKMKADSIDADRKRTDELYVSYLRVGDKNFEDKLYDKAKNTYNAALEVKPNDPAVKALITSKLKAIDDKIVADSLAAKRLEEENLYTGYIALADKAFKEQSYDVARSNYSEALQVKPGNVYATGQIKKINIAVAESQKQAEKDLTLQKDRERQDQYRSIVSVADQYYNSGKYAEAKEQYAKALELNKTDIYCKNKIAQINKTLAAQTAKITRDSIYGDAIAKADKAFDIQDYATAKLLYVTALKYKEDDLYAKEKLNKIEKAIAEEAANKQAEKDSLQREAEETRKYNALLASAKTAYTANDYTTAKVMYAAAIDLKPNEEEPKQKLAEIENKLGEMAKVKERAELLDSLISTGDIALANQQLDTALSNYEEALSLNPDDKASYLQKQINYINSELAKKESVSTQHEERTVTNESLYDTYIKSADEAFNSKSYDAAQADYTDALNIQPADTYARNQLEKIDRIFEAARNQVEKTNVTRNNNEDANRADIKAAREIDAGMMLIRAHVFKMGNDEGRTDETPMHVVKVDSFYLGQFEVTQAQWQSIMGSNPSGFKNCDSCPVENISWNDATAFIEKLNALSNKKYRLPTEAEWEYVAGAQSFRKEKFQNMGWYYDNSKRATHPVGRLKPNFFSVYDMFGNVAEWCNDWYNPNAYKRDAQINPKGPATGKEKVVRGGAWYDYEVIFQNTYRDKMSPNKASNKIGIRLAADVD